MWSATASTTASCTATCPSSAPCGRASTTCPPCPPSPRRPPEPAAFPAPGRHAGGGLLRPRGERPPKGGGGDRRRGLPGAPSGGLAAGRLPVAPLRGPQTGGAAGGRGQEAAEEGCAFRLRRCGQSLRKGLGKRVFELSRPCGGSGEK